MKCYLYSFVGDGSSQSQHHEARRRPFSSILRRNRNSLSKHQVRRDDHWQLYHAGWRKLKRYQRKMFTMKMLWTWILLVIILIFNTYWNRVFPFHKWKKFKLVLRRRILNIILLLANFQTIPSNYIRIRKWQNIYFVFLNRWPPILNSSTFWSCPTCTATSSTTWEQVGIYQTFHTTTYTDKKRQNFL